MSLKIRVRKKRIKIHNINNITQKYKLNEQTIFVQKNAVCLVTALSSFFESPQPIIT